MIKTSHSAVVTYQECPRKRYLKNHFADTGLVRSNFSTDTFCGSLVHMALEKLLPHASAFNSSDLREIFDAARRDIMSSVPEDVDVTELVALAEGLVRCWVAERLPRIVADYEIFYTEEEQLEQIAPDVIYMNKIDFVLRRKVDGEFVALDFKTTGWLTPELVESYRYSQQMLAHLNTLRRTFGIDTGYVQVEFLDRGRQYRGESTSPLVRGWKRESVVRNEVDYDWEYKRTKGWDKFKVYEESFPGIPGWMTPMEFWVEHVLPPEIRKGQLATSRPLFFSAEEIAEWKETTANQEQLIADRLKVDDPIERMKLFPAIKGRNCYLNKYKRSCPYLDICFGLTDLDEALQGGKYERREPHYRSERAR